MKKLLLVLAIAAFVACNDSGNTEEATSTDSAATAPVPAPTPDSTTVIPDTTKPADSLKK